MEESDSRTSSVGRKRTSHTVPEINLEDDAASDSSSQNAIHNRKRRKPNEDEIGGHSATISQQTNPEPKLKEEGGVESVGKSASMPISWNKGVQATLRTSFGRGTAARPNKSTHDVVAMDGTSIGDLARPDENPTSDMSESKVASPSSGNGESDTSQPSTALSKRAAKRTRKKSTKLENTVHTGIDVPTNKVSRTKKGANNLETIQVQGLDLIIPTPSGRGKKSIKGYVIKDLKNNFFPKFLTLNEALLGQLDQEKIVEAAKQYIDRGHKDNATKAAALLGVNKEDWHNMAKNQLKKAIHNVGLGTSTNISSRLRGSLSENTVPPVQNSLVSQLGHETGGPTPSEAFSQSVLADQGEEHTNPQDTHEASLIREEVNEANGLIGVTHEEPVITSLVPHPEVVLDGRSTSEEPYSPRLEDVSVYPSVDLQAIDPTVAESSEAMDIDVEPQLVVPVSQPVDETDLMDLRKYYPGLNAATFICLICCDSGHTAASCPSLTCPTCLTRGIHFSSGCPKTIRCTKCRVRGHDKSSCPEKLGLGNNERGVCDTCGSSKHTEAACHMMWRSFNPEKVEIRKVQTLLIDCYSCGAAGHFGPECGLYQGASRSGGYTWSSSNVARYTDAQTSNRAISAGKDYTIPPKKGNGFSIKGSASNNPVTFGDSDDDDVSFIRAKVAPPQQKSHIRFSDKPVMAPLPSRNGPPPQRYAPPPPPQPVYRPADSSARYGREREFSSPPRYPDYHDDRMGGRRQYHDFNGDGRGEPRPPARGPPAGMRSAGNGFPGRDSASNRGPPPNMGGRPQNMNGARPDTHNVPPPQSLAGKKSGRSRGAKANGNGNGNANGNGKQNGGSGRGGARGGFRGGGGRGRK